MYSIITKDRDEITSITKDQIIHWIKEGKQDHIKLIKPEGSTSWRALSEIDEFKELLLKKLIDESELPTEKPGIFYFLKDPQDIGITKCVEDGFRLFKNNYRDLYLLTFIYFLIKGVLLAIYYKMPYQYIILAIEIIVYAPLFGGLCHAFLKLAENNKASIADLFYGFTKNTIQCITAWIVSSALVLLLFIPAFFILYMILSLLSVSGLRDNYDLAQAANVFNIAIPINFFSYIDFWSSKFTYLKHSLGFYIGLYGMLLILSIPAVNLASCWAFTIPLTIEKQSSFKDALRLGIKKVGGNWHVILRLFLLIGLMSFIAMLFIGYVIKYLIETLNIKNIIGISEYRIFTDNYILTNIIYAFGLFFIFPFIISIYIKMYQLIFDRKD